MGERRVPPPDYRRLDRPEVLLFVFHPRPEPALTRLPDGAVDVRVPVDGDTHLGARFHRCASAAPTVLFFHGNGEIVADYDELGPFYNRRGLNFFAVDYRGYGRSGGRPSIRSLLCDAPLVLDFARGWLAHRDCRGPLIVMGRSLGSAAALELAAERAEDFDGLVIESGFAWSVPLLRLLGVDVEALGIVEDGALNQTKKIAAFTKPTLVIHAERDHIIPYADAEALYAASGAAHKRLLKIPRANHNDIMVHGLDALLSAVAALATAVRA